MLRMIRKISVRAWWVQKDQKCTTEQRSAIAVNKRATQFTMMDEDR